MLNKTQYNRYCKFCTLLQLGNDTIDSINDPLLLLLWYLMLHYLNVQKTTTQKFVTFKILIPSFLFCDVVVGECTNIFPIAFCLQFLKTSENEFVLYSFVRCDNCN